MCDDFFWTSELDLISTVQCDMDKVPGGNPDLPEIQLANFKALAT